MNLKEEDPLKYAVKTQEIRAHIQAVDVFLEAQKKAEGFDYEARKKALDRKGHIQNLGGIK